MRTWVAFVLCSLPALAQDDYIEKTFRARIGEVPRIGWLDGEKAFLTSQNVPRVSIYGPVGTPIAANKKGEIKARRLQLFRLACELQADDTLSVFGVEENPSYARALYTTKPLPGQTRAGAVSVALDEQHMEDVNRVLGWPARGALRRDEALAVRAGSFFYSFHQLYSQTTGLLRQEAVILHGRDGHIISLDLERNADTAAYCDGCSPPSYGDSYFGTHHPLNLFDLPGFPYPVVLLDTGTVEGRALSLLTFTPDGKLATFRDSEYVVNCGEL